MLRFSHINIVRRIFFYLIESNGAMAIKMTQWYGSLHRNSFVVNRVYDDILEHSYSYTCKTFQKSMKIPLHERYTINKSPIASGSIGQVYRGIEKLTGREIVIKVRHPNIGTEASVYVRIITCFISWMTCVYTGHSIKSILDVDAFFKSYMEQIDMGHEAQNLKRLSEDFKDSSMVIIPEPIEWSDDILVMTYHTGKSYDDIKDDLCLYRKVTLMLYIIIRVMTMTNGFLHCDLHKGNWRYNAESDAIILYDAGHTAHIDNERMQLILKKMYDGGTILECLKDYINYGTDDKINNFDLDEWFVNNKHFVEIGMGNVQPRNVMRGMIKFSEDNKVSINHGVLSILLANISLETDLSEHGFVSHPDAMNDILKEELSMCLQHNSFQQHQEFLKSVICNKDTFTMSTLDVSLFYDIKERTIE